MTKQTIEGYKLPADYFDTLQKRIDERMHREPKTAGMSVPEDYFRQSQETVLAAADPVSIKIVHRRVGIYRWGMAAASIAVLVAALVTILPTGSDTQSAALLASVSVDTVLDDADMLEELSLQQLAMLMDEVDVEEIGLELQDHEDLPESVLQDADWEELEDLF